MKVLCPDCGAYHDVIRTLEDGVGDEREDVDPIFPTATCPRTWLRAHELLAAAGRFGLAAKQTGEEE